MSNRTITIQRQAASPRVPRASMHCGAAECDITPHPDLPLAGYSTEAAIATGVRGHLFARALYLCDERGEDVVLCFLDMMSASRLLLEMVAARTTPAIGIDRIVLAGTHTHSGPAHFYGNSLYDFFASKKPGFDEALCTWLADRVAATILEARDRAVPARVGVSVRPVVGVSKNRSLPAFQNNPDWRSWLHPPLPGSLVPPEFALEQRTIDPRLSVIAAVREADDHPLAAFGIFGCHPTAVGPQAAWFSSDLAGDAVRVARWDLERRRGEQVVVAIATGAAGDANSLRHGLQPEIPVGPELSEWVGERLGAGLATAAEEARQAAAAAQVTVWFHEPRASDPPPSQEDLELSPHARFGAPTLAGSEESPTGFRRFGLAWESMRSEVYRGTPQYPKAPALGPLQPFMNKLFGLAPSDVFPLHAVRIGGAMIATVPGEPTSMAAFDIERELLAVEGVRSVHVLGYAGDYGGYYTTRAEYDAQHYEGSSMLRGRNAAAHIRARLAQMVRGQHRQPVTGPVRFETLRTPNRFSGSDDIPAVVDPRPTIATRNGRRVQLHWSMPRGSRVVFGNGAWVTLEEHVDAQWRPLRNMGRPFDDVHQPILIQRVEALTFAEDVLDALGLRQADETWLASFELPKGAVGRALRIHVGARDGFPGFTVSLDGS